MPNTLEREAYLFILGSTRSLSAAYLAQGAVQLGASHRHLVA
jgi:hypothetical protein